jgi:hypothetical protein
MHETKQRKRQFHNEITEADVNDKVFIDSLSDKEESNVTETVAQIIAANT